MKFQALDWKNQMIMCLHLASEEGRTLAPLNIHHRSHLYPPLSCSPLSEPRLKNHPGTSDSKEPRLQVDHRFLPRKCIVEHAETRGQNLLW
jgi:hypothetical protein